MSNDNEFGDKIRQLRLTKDLSLRDLSKLSGVSFSFISSIESGRYQASRKTVKSLAKALGAKENELLLLAGYAPRSHRPQTQAEADQMREDFLAEMMSEAHDDDMRRFVIDMSENVDGQFYLDYSGTSEERKERFWQMMNDARLIWHMARKGEKD